MALRHEHAKDADRSQRFRQIGWNPPRVLDLRGARGDAGRQFPYVGEQTPGCICLRRRIESDALDHGTADATVSAHGFNSIRGTVQIYSGGGSVAVPGRLRCLETKVLSPQADVLEQMVVEPAQLLSRAIAFPAQPDGGGDPVERRQRRDTARAGAM